jgi:hypothetical protein
MKGVEPLNESSVIDNDAGVVEAKPEYEENPSSRTNNFPCGFTARRSSAGSLSRRRCPVMQNRFEQVSHRRLGETSRPRKSSGSLVAMRFRTYEGGALESGITTSKYSLFYRARPAK